MSGYPSPTLYDVLQVRSDATTQDVRNAWRRLAQEHHPDRGDGGDGEAMTRINHAYAVLSDPDKRARYDQQLLALRKPRRRSWALVMRQHGALLTGIAVAATVVLAAGAWTVLRGGSQAQAAAQQPDTGPAGQAHPHADPPLRLIPARSIETWVPARSAQDSGRRPADSRASR
jgi:curved DNA-binding protein CbpA